MKKAKYIVLLLAALLSLTLASCSCEHEWVLDLTSSTATCTEDGRVAYYCKLCEKERWVAESKGHVYAVVEAIEPTCVRDGRTKGERCLRCFEVFSVSEPVAMTGHSYTDIYDDHCNDCGAYRKPNVMFMHGLMPKVLESGKVGYVNEAGEWVIEPIFGSADPFTSAGYARVVYQNRYAVIDTKGEFKIEPGVYSRISDFNSRGYAEAQKVAAQIILDTEFNVVEGAGKSMYSEKTSDNGYRILEQNGRYVIEGPDGKLKLITVDCDLNSFWGGFSSNGYARFSLNGKYGYIDERGDVVIEPIYDYAERFAACGLALVGKEQNGIKSFGYINERGEEVIPLKFSSAESFGEDGIALVEGKKLINTRGEILVSTEERIAKNARFTENGLCVVTNGYRNYGYIDRDGKLVISVSDGVANDFSTCGIARISINGGAYYINERGEKLFTVNALETGDFTDDGYVKCSVYNSDLRKTTTFVMDAAGNKIEALT